jgi:light-independent protochlorophyllide reductase subunit B
VTDVFQHVARRIADLSPELVCGTQMERHACRKLDIPCLVIAPPTHIENHLLSYRPVLGFDGADVLADAVYTTATLGMEKHLIDMFGDAGLDYDEPRTEEPRTGNHEVRSENRASANGHPEAGVSVGAAEPSAAPSRSVVTEESRSRNHTIIFYRSPRLDSRCPGDAEEDTLLRAGTGAEERRTVRGAARVCNDHR